MGMLEIIPKQMILSQGFIKVRGDARVTSPDKQEEISNVFLSLKPTTQEDVLAFIEMLRKSPDVPQGVKDFMIARLSKGVKTPQN